MSAIPVPPFARRVSATLEECPEYDRCGSSGEYVLDLLEAGVIDVNTARDLIHEWDPIYGTEFGATLDGMGLR